jgi:hypothetical protein
MGQLGEHPLILFFVACEYGDRCARPGQSKGDRPAETSCRC